MGNNLKFVFICAFVIFLFYFSLINNSVGYENDASNLAAWADWGYYVMHNQQNHLLQTSINKIWYDLFKLFGFRGSSLMPLRVLSCIFGAFGVVGFFILLRIIFKSNIISLFGSAGLAFSHYYWAFSTDLETHLLPASVFIYCLILLFSINAITDISKIKFLAILHSVCIFLSGIYVFFIPAVAAGIISVNDNLRSRYKLLGRYFIYIFIFWFLPYLAIGVYFFFHSYADELKYASGLLHHLFIWFGGSTPLVPWRLVNLPLYYANVISYTYCLSAYLVVAALSFYLLTLVIFLRSIRHIVSKYARVLIVSFAIIIPYQFALLNYEPWNMERCMHFTSAFWLILCSILEPYLRARNRLISLLSLAFIILTFYSNLVYYIYPRHIVALGPVRQKLVDDLNKQVEELSRRRQYQDALKPLKEIGGVLIRTFGYNHPYVVKYADRLYSLYIKLGRNDEAAQVRAI